MYPMYKQQRRRSHDNLEYYVNGVRVTKPQYAKWLSMKYGVSPTEAIQDRVRDAKRLMALNHCKMWQFPDGSLVKY